LSAAGTGSRKSALDLDDELRMDVRAVKVNHGRLSIANCFAAALARRRDCPLRTADHHEMDALLGTGIVGLRFIR
jgi:hypothetical protein